MFKPSSSSLLGSQPCRLFEFSEIQLATEDFDESLVIGHGCFGKVYRVTISNGSTPVDAAIKRLDSMSNQGAAEFWAEVEMLSKLRHCNLVSLIGYCNHGKEMILVYEYMPNGTLEDHLHKLGTPLSWIQRINICIGAGRGLHYLHTGTGIDVGVIHRDVKSSNILLHESWAAKISDFGLSKIGPTNQPSTYVNTLVKGTFGYFDPDYYATGKLTRKSDVYAFGVVLLEVLCRKRAVDTSLDEEQWNLARWAQESIKEGNLKQIIDPDIRGEISPKCLKEFVRIAEGCLHSKPKQRSAMAEVVVGLECALALQEKFNTSVQLSGRTIFGRIINMLPFPSNRENSAGLKNFKFDDLKSATSNFSQDQLLSEGSFGRVFLGWVDKKTFAPSRPGVGITVAVKRHYRANVGYAKWQEEMPSRLYHPNIISPLGSCSDVEHEYLLVYEYIPNRSFDLFLYPESPATVVPLSWETRLSILIGAARGLAYVHSSDIIYDCIESRNILLDQDFNAKLGCLGLHTFGPMDPWNWDYMKGHVKAKKDIYGYGVVMLETLIGKPAWDAMDHDEQVKFLLWTRPFPTDKNEIRKLMDPCLKENYPLEGAFKMAALVKRCLRSPEDRPSSEQILQSLEEIYALNK